MWPTTRWTRREKFLLLMLLGVAIYHQYHALASMIRSKLIYSRNSDNNPSSLRDTSLVMVKQPAENKQQNPSTQPPVGIINFVHIPKTGGTTVETLGKKNNHGCGFWGSRMVGNETLREQYNWDSGYYWQPVSVPAVDVKSGVTSRLVESSCAEWHMPPNLLNTHLRDELYPAQDTFCIIRHPLRRLISHYYYSHAGPQRQKMKKTIVVDGVEQTTTRVYRRYTRGPCFNDGIAYTNKFLADELRRAMKNPGAGGCHLLPQSSFLSESVIRQAGAEGEGAAARGGEWPQCNRVLVLEENLSRQFNQLMSSIECPIRLSNQRHINKRRAVCRDDAILYTEVNAHMQGREFRQITVSDLSKEVLRLAEVFYGQDLRVYEYYAEQVRKEITSDGATKTSRERTAN